MFGPSQPTSSLSLFGNAQNTATNAPLFGPAQPAQQQASSFFGNTSTFPIGGAQSMSAPIYQSPPVQPIVLGADINEIALQHAIIDAQISSLPYGDSPLLKMSST